MLLHLDLKQRVEDKYGAQLDGEITLKQDAMIVPMGRGLVVEVRYLNPEEYSILWTRTDAQFRIDTAPLHRNLDTFPNHMHDRDGNVVADFLTRPGADPWDNVSRVLDHLLTMPFPEAGGGS